ncbi:MBOAT family protein, partial [Aliarcobacter butzleri]
VLHPLFESKLGFLSNYGINFGAMFENIEGSKEIIVWLLFAFILVLVSKNSMSYFNSNFKANYKMLFFMEFLIYISIVSMMTVKSEFLYFNF